MIIDHRTCVLCKKIVGILPLNQCEKGCRLSQMGPSLRWSVELKLQIFAQREKPLSQLDYCTIKVKEVVCAALLEAACTIR
jgi:hypothetical protein